MIDYLTSHIQWVILGGVIIAIILSFIPKIDILIEKLSRFFMYTSVIALILLSLLVTYDVITRKLFSGGSIALQELEWHLFDIVFLFGIAFTLSKDKHVRVDILYDKFPKKIKLLINFLSIVLFVIPLSILIIVEALPFVQMSYLQHEASGDPGGLCCRWIIKSSMIIAFIMVYLQSIAELRKIYLRIKK